MRDNPAGAATTTMTLWTIMMTLTTFYLCPSQASVRRDNDSWFGTRTNKYGGCHVINVASRDLYVLPDGNIVVFTA